MNDGLPLGISSDSDAALLDQFVRLKSDDAFRQLAERHAALVHGAALRLLKNDAARADDAAQAVFIVLAQKAGSIRNKAALAAWLYRTTLLVVENMRRVESRRRRHETEAAKMASVVSSPDDARTQEAVRNELDAALAQLKPKLQEAVVLHYLKGVPREDVARTLGCSLEAIHKRLSGAIEKLRAAFESKGISLSASGIGSILAAQALHAPRDGCAAACHAAAMGALKATSAASVPAALAKAAIKMLWWSKVKAAGIAAGVTIFLAAGGMSAQHLLRAGEAPLPVKPAGGDEKAEAPAKLPYPPTKIAGMVVDRLSNQPLAGIKVSLRGQQPSTDQKDILPLPGAKTDDGVPSTVSGADGKFELMFMTPSHKRLTTNLYVGSQMSQQINAYQGETIVADILQEMRTESSTVTGTVVDDKGKPVAGATVRGAAFSQGITTDKDGKFTDTMVPSHRFGWMVTAPGFELKRFDFWIGDGKRDPVIPLVPCKPVSGKVVDAAGKPVPNVRILAGTTSVGFYPQWSTESNAAGEFVMGTMPENSVPMPIFPVSGYDPIGPIQHVSAGQSGVVVQLYPTGRFEATVVDEKGNPIADQRVRLMSSDNEMNKLRFVKADAKGLAVIDAMPAGTFKVEVFGPEKGTKAPPPVDLTVVADQTTKTRLVCTHPDGPQTYKLTGYILDKEGKPVLHAIIMGCLKTEAAVAGMSDPEGTGYTEVDGRFEIDLLRSPPFNGRDGKRMWEPLPPEGPGKVRIVAAFVGGQGEREYFVDKTIVWEKDKLACDAGKLTATIDPERIITIDTDPHAWLWRVFGADGKTIHDLPLPKLSPEDRSVRFSVHKNGALKATLKNDNGESVDVAIPAERSEKPLTAQFRKPRSVALTVLDESGKPLEGATFFGPDGNIETFPKARGSKSTAAGVLSFDCSPSATGKFSLYKDPHYELYFGQITPGDAPLALTITLKTATASLTGKMLDKNGEPVAKAKLHIQINPEGAMNMVDYCAIDVKEDGSYSTPLPSGVLISLAGEADSVNGRLASRSEWTKVAAGQKVELDAALVSEMEAMFPPPKKTNIAKPKPVEKPPVKPPSTSDF